MGGRGGNGGGGDFGTGMNLPATGGANLRRRAAVPSANKGGRSDAVKIRRLHLAQRRPALINEPQWKQHLHEIYQQTSVINVAPLPFFLCNAVIVNPATVA